MHLHIPASTIAVLWSSFIQSKSFSMHSRWCIEIETNNEARDDNLKHAILLDRQQTILEACKARWNVLTRQMSGSTSILFHESTAEEAVWVIHVIANSKCNAYSYIKTGANERMSHFLQLWVWHMWPAVELISPMKISGIRKWVEPIIDRCVSRLFSKCIVDCSIEVVHS